MNWSAKWIKPKNEMGYVVPVFAKSFALSKKAKKATLYISAMGVYEASINGHRVGDFILAPGWTAYEKRLQYQEYDVTSLLAGDNKIEVLVAHGWYYLTLRTEEQLRGKPIGLIAELCVEYADGESEIISTDESWTAGESCMRKSEIYDGEIFDATFTPDYSENAVTFDGNYSALIAQEGAIVKEHERFCPKKIFKTPKGELVIDFGQNMTGYILTKVNASAGEVVDISYAEVMDRDGNFYNENYLNARCEYHYICRDGYQEHKPSLTFCGFRYIRVNQFPGGIENVTRDTFTAIAVYSEMKRTGYIESSNPLLNQLFSNVIWGQKGNFLDIPSDCPQRNERLGWTGDAHVFAKTACYNFDCEKFFSKWLGDARAEQGENGFVPYVVPDIHKSGKASAAWGDIISIIPWEIYLAYGDKKILKDNFEAIKKWVDFYDTIRTPEYALNERFYELSFGDWLGLDAPQGSWRGTTSRDLIYLAFYYYSTLILCRAGKILGRDVGEYEELAQKLKSIFQKKYPEYKTQTECTLAIHFGLAEDAQATADRLAEMLRRDGHLMTGFVGTPYLLHALSEHGHADLAYSLLLKTDYPSWLYPVTKGATTIWEHWDSIMPDGSFWDKKMNSFNHYAYGSVADWIYSFASGIRPSEGGVGYTHATISPHPDTRLDFLKCTLDTRRGTIKSEWKKEDGKWRYDITTPVDATVIIGADTYNVSAGEYTFYSEM